MATLTIHELRDELRAGFFSNRLDDRVMIYDKDRDHRYYVEAVIPADAQGGEPTVIVLGKAEDDCEHDFVPVNNDGKAACRFCGEPESD